MKEIFMIEGYSGVNIQCYNYLPDNKVIEGIVYFAHGITEYAERHEELFKFLNEEGWAVFTNDHMGHGNSGGPRGYFTPTELSSGWECAVIDSMRCIDESYYRTDIDLNLPLVGIGFSLGSFIVRDIAIRNQYLFNSLILIGTGYQSKLKLKLGKLIADLELVKHKPSDCTDTIYKMAFEEYNKKFDKCRKADWLTSDKVELNRYLIDQKCNAGISIGLFKYLLSGIEFVSNAENIRKMRVDIEIYLISGEDDPVGDFGEGIHKLSALLETNNVTVYDKLYKGMRHDLLHEKCKEEIFDEISLYLSFMKRYELRRYDAFGINKHDLLKYM